ncbi:MAG: Spy/CpxP family protein refolding chaperone [Pseudomonadota bacterium]
MKTNRKILAGLILAAGIGGASLVIAQPGMGMKGGCDGSGPMGQMGRHAAMKFDPAERAEQRLDYLKYQLKITAAQEPLWNAYAEKMKAGAGKGMQAMRDAGDEKLAAPARMAKMQSLMEERLAAMKGVHESFERLYAALTPEQKAIADKQAARMGKGGPRHG